jgi:alkanesulfonate monooxygenase SsuD/methylene tetrahydromethanopterin reductase-like flavin-dependent oxidoreductase (luciferase family)
MTSTPSTRFDGPRPRLLISAFVMNTSSHIMGGQWRRPEAQQHRFNELQLWIDLARQLEDAKFDAIFFADVVGLYGDYDGGWASLLKKGLQVPSNDPLILLSALATGTREIGLAATSSVIQSHPFQFARQMSTLDHISDGRVAWNIVTSVLENAHRNFNATELTKHDERYDWADEYVEAAYKLWEGSWEDDALLRDKATGVHADPEKVSKIYHRGPRYSIDGPHLAAPSPQRTPVLFQAGSSGRGQQFCAANAEATFTLAPSTEVAAKYTAAVREQAVELEDSLDIEALLAHVGGGFGVDLGGLPLDTPLGDLETEGSQGHLTAIRASVRGGNPTLRDIALYRSRANRVVGTPDQIADRLEQWQDAGIDGINIINQTIPGSYTDFIDGVLPELRSRGLAQTGYAPGTLREKLFGAGPRLNGRHPAAAFRGAFTEFSAAAENQPASVTAQS